jgi:hypothetical protein
VTKSWSCSIANRLLLPFDVLLSATEFVMAMTAVKGTSTESIIQSSACKKENELSVTRRKILWMVSR